MSFPGIPPLLNPIASLERKVVLLTSDALLVVALFSQATPQWGLYQNGQIAVKADSIAHLDYRADYSVLDYPVEKGAFESYNKVKTPREVRLRMMKGGSQESRSTFLKALETLQASLDLVDVYMPEAKYIGMNLKGVNFARSAESGVGLLSVDVILIEIMQTVVAQFTNTAADSGRAVQNGGTQLPDDATDAQKARAGSL